MESLSIGLSSSPPFINHRKTLKLISKSNFVPPKPLPNRITFFNSISHSINSHRTYFPLTKKTALMPQTHTENEESNQTSSTHISNLSTNHLIFQNVSSFQTFLRTQISFICVGLSFPLSCFASETTVSTEEVSNKINLEAIVVSVDDFFNRNPFFVAGVTFIWLVVIPLTQEYLQKYKFVSAIDAFRKLRDDPSTQLLDIRDKKSLGYLGSPNLKILNKGVVQVEFSEGDGEGFVKKVLEKFREPENTTICVLDNFDGDSMKVAELLVKNGFKEAYAIRGGIRGKKGWQAIQETLLPPSVHIYPSKKVKMSKQLETNGVVKQANEVNKKYSSVITPLEGRSEQMDNGYVNKSIKSTPLTNCARRSSSPYPNYPDMKPPSSPTPSKPQN
ncbi:unnamed protein product [Ilex paraguariensis]|uniref:Rhodanese domain-containing protein n=1 Tax=Ilex paraguariensis TaxID=185542 RepID=A0ABC8R3Z9_9AQUA